MADRPLRPATRRCLGGPLPRQQADRPRAPPEAKKHFFTKPCGSMKVSGISTGFPVLSQSSGQVAHVVLTRSPLNLPECKHSMDSVRLACVKHAASVHSEPESNSPSRFSDHRSDPSNQRVGSGTLNHSQQTSFPTGWFHWCTSFYTTGRLFRDRRPAVLAFGSRSSVFKERHHTRPEPEVRHNLEWNRFHSFATKQAWWQGVLP